MKIRNWRPNIVCFKRKTKIMAIITLIICFGFYANWYSQVDQEDSRSGTAFEEVFENTSKERSWEEGETAWKKEQERRKRIIKDVCKNLSLPRTEILDSLLLAPMQFLRHLLVDDQRKALYCYIPKVACTNWKKVWMALTGLTHGQNLSSIPHMTIHGYTRNMELVINTKNISTLRKKLTSYKKVIVLRHPFHRLASAYRDKIYSEDGHPYYKNLVLKYALKRRVSANLTNIQWPEFVDYLTTGRGKNENDHWNSYERLCHPCVLDYDVIAKFETLQEDSERFLQLIGAPEDLNFPNTSTTSRRVDDDLWNDYRRSLTSNQLIDLYQTYERDFKLFEYN